MSERPDSLAVFSKPLSPEETRYLIERRRALITELKALCVLLGCPVQIVWQKTCSRRIAMQDEVSKVKA